MRVPFNQPALTGNEIRYILDAVRRRSHLSGDGFYTQQCSAWLRRFIGARQVLLTPSCTQALEMAFMLLGIGPGDEVLVPSFTFPSSANAFVLHGANPVFVDIRSDTLNMNEQQLESHITRRTKAVVAVHYAGVPCQMDVILRVAAKHRLAVVEDAAQALGAKFKGQPAGSLGVLNAFSFHETKNCHCGEGGALIISKASHERRAEIIRQKGTNRDQFYRGQVDKYSWVDIGSSYVPSELQAAFLYAQLQNLSKIRAKRRRLYETYWRALAPYQAKGKVVLPVIPEDCESSYHLFHILLEDERSRDRIMQKLRRRGVVAIFHFFPLHLSAMGRRYGYGPGSLPVTENISGRLLRLPLYNTMTSAEQQYVIRCLTDLLG